MEKLVGLLINGLLSFWGETSPFLLNEFIGRVHAELVRDDCWVDSCHIFLLLDKDLYISFQELNQKVLDLCTQFRSHVN